LGQLAATFSSNTQLQNVAAQSANIAGGAPSLNSGTTVQGTSLATLPAVYQVGFDPATQAAINAQIANFVAANTITPQQAVFNANQSRTAILAAINEIITNFGNYGYDLMLQYRGIAVSIQQATEAAIASSQNLVTVYVTPTNMSLRQIAFANGLSPDSQNAIETLNPYLGSVNYVPANTTLIVPAA
jgi:hypothetical protein